MDPEGQFFFIIIEFSGKNFPSYRLGLAPHTAKINENYKNY